MFSSGIEDLSLPGRKQASVSKVVRVCIACRIESVVLGIKSNNGRQKPFRIISTRALGTQRCMQTYEAKYCISKSPLP